MRLGFASWRFILCTLVVFLILQDSVARKIATTSGNEVQLKEVSYDLQKLATEGLVLDSIIQLEGADIKRKNKHVHKDEARVKKGIGFDIEEEEDKNDHKKIVGKDVHGYKPSHEDHKHMDLELNVFFTPNDLKVGKIMPIYFSKKNSSTSPKFLTREEADQIPFSSKHLPSLLKFFSIPKHSPQAKAMKYTLKQCEFESMEERPSSFFTGHSQHSDTNLYEVMVEGENGGRVQAAAICHMDTSKWDRDHVSFRVLKVEPGTSPVCHFFPPDNLVWVPLPLAP
uniref:BURP domain-containing protein n=1 Tax=Glycine max TaxID=3847 RepID=A0A368UJD5_SOYBN